MLRPCTPCSRISLFICTFSIQPYWQGHRNIGSPQFHELQIVDLFLCLVLCWSPHAIIILAPLLSVSLHSIVFFSFYRLYVESSMSKISAGTQGQKSGKFEIVCGQQSSCCDDGHYTTKRCPQVVQQSSKSIPTLVCKSSNSRPKAVQVYGKDLFFCLEKMFLRSEMRYLSFCWFRKCYVSIWK